jgi:hypothetical protein
MILIGNVPLCHAPKASGGDLFLIQNTMAAYFCFVRKLNFLFCQPNARSEVKLSHKDHDFATGLGVSVIGTTIHLSGVADNIRHWQSDECQRKTQLLGVNLTQCKTAQYKPSQNL